MDILLLFGIGSKKSYSAASNPRIRVFLWHQESVAEVWMTNEPVTSVSRKMELTEAPHEDKNKTTRCYMSVVNSRLCVWVILMPHIFHSWRSQLFFFSHNQCHKLVPSANRGQFYSFCRHIPNLLPPPLLFYSLFWTKCSFIFPKRLIIFAF